MPHRADLPYDVAPRSRNRAIAAALLAVEFINPQAREAIAISSEISNRRLLLVEDDPLFQRLVVECLHPIFSINIADDGAQAASLASDFPPDIAIIDMHLPCISGAEVIQMFRNDPELAGTPVLVMSSDTGLDTIFTAINAGSDEFIRKRDISRKSLLAAIERISAPVQTIDAGWTAAGSASD